MLLLLLEVLLGGIVDVEEVDDAGPHAQPRLAAQGQGRERHCARGVALQVASERQTLKPVFHLIGYRLWV
jgi:hypothetical protein